MTVNQLKNGLEREIKMLNAEKYRAEIFGKDCDFGLSNRIHGCCYEGCATCVFSLENNPNDGLSNACTIRKVKWLLSEYKEPVKLTRFEHDVLKYLLENTQYRFIARERNDTIYIYTRKPKKGSDAWEIISGMRNFNLFINLFPFIEWEDEEPKSIKKILNNCEVSDGES